MFKGVLKYLLSLIVVVMSVFVSKADPTPFCDNIKYTQNIDEEAIIECGSISDISYSLYTDFLSSDNNFVADNNIRILSWKNSNTKVSFNIWEGSVFVAQKPLCKCSHSRWVLNNSPQAIYYIYSLHKIRI